MEYVFGFKDKKEILRTKGDYHTDLSGANTVLIQTDADETTHEFVVVQKYRTDEDVEGNCYDWYEIDHHNSHVDKTKRVESELEQTNAAIGLASPDHELSPGEYVTHNGKMYRVTLSIPAGGMIAPGTNAEETTIATELNNI